MILCDREIEQAIKQKKIIIEPAPKEDQYTTSALDLFLGDEIFELRSQRDLAAEEPEGVERNLIINPSNIDMQSFLQKYAIPLKRENDGSFILQPDKFILGITRERIELPRSSKIAARVEGRSTLARLGLLVHLTAPTIHAGFSGKIVLEMVNFGKYPLRLCPSKLAICQLIFERLGAVPKGPVRTKYQGQQKIK